MRGFFGTHSYEDVRTEKVRFNGLVADFAQTLIAQTSALNGNFTAAQQKFNADWQAWFSAWNAFNLSGTTQLWVATWYDSLPDDAEWSTLMAFETQFPSYVTQAQTLYPKGGYITPVTATDTTTFSWGSLYPSLPPNVNATLTSLTYVAGVAALLFYGGPILFELEALAGQAGANITTRRSK